MWDKDLKKNITNLYGQKGKDWLNNLPDIIIELSANWSLTDIVPVTNLSYNYVVKATKDNKHPVVLKIACDEIMIRDEIKALHHFDGKGAIELLDVRADFNALLLEQAIPGASLKSCYRENMAEVMDNYTSVAKQLASIDSPKQHEFPHIRDWLKAIDNANDAIIPKHLLSMAKDLKKQLLTYPSNEYVSHGDLHQDNIIQHDNEWLAIDPKGVIGNLYFESAKFDFIHEEELKDITVEYQKRILLLAKKLALEPYLLTQWVFIRFILAAAWCIEDNGDPGEAIAMAKHVYPLLGQPGEANND